MIKYLTTLSSAEELLGYIDDVQLATNVSGFYLHTKEKFLTNKPLIETSVGEFFNYFGSRFKSFTPDTEYLRLLISKSDTAEENFFVAIPFEGTPMSTKEDSESVHIVVKESRYLVFNVIGRYSKEDIILYAESADVFL